MRRSLSLILIFLAVILTVKKFPGKKPETIDSKYGNYLSCQGYPFDLKLKFQSSVYLLKSALPKDKDDLKRLYYGAAYYQNLYTFSHVTELNPNSKLKWTEITHIEPKIKTLQTEEVPYPFDIELEEINDMSGFPPLSKNYIQNLVRLKSIPKGSKAIKVSYEFETNLLTCFTENDPHSIRDISFYQPMDPFVSYFMVPKKERILVKNSARSTEAVVNPCLDPQGITPNGFQPLGYWYFWNPFRSIKDSFDCKKYYSPGLSLNEIKVQYEENNPKAVTDLDFSKFDFKDRPIKFTILLGANENLNFIPIQKDKFLELLKTFTSELSDEKAFHEINTNKDTFDTRIPSFLFFYRNLNKHLFIKDMKTDIEEYSFNIKIKGQLKFSRKDLELVIAMAPNHPDSKGKEKFDQYFSESFLNSDIFTYLGHVNGGRVFQTVLNERREDILKNQNSEIKYQIFGLFSCSSGYFFNYKDFPKPIGEAFQRDILMSASSFRDFGLPPILALIAQIDGEFYNKTTIPFLNWSKFSNSDNFFVLYNDK